MTRAVYILILACLAQQVIAQKSDNSTIGKKYPNQICKSLFSDHPGIDYVHLSYIYKKPDLLSISFRKDSINKRSAHRYESYDLEFEGDHYLLQKRYKQIPILPQAEIDDLVNMQRWNGYYNLSATIYKDSVEYSLSQNLSSNEKEYIYDRFYKPAPVFKGDIKELAKGLEEKYNNGLQSPLQDSILIFTGFVDKDTLNRLQNITLTEGSSSSFSDLIQQGLENAGRVWSPMFQGGRAVKSYAKIYAQLTNDGHIILSTPKSWP